MREQVIRSKHEDPFELLVLIGRRRLSWPRDVYLTGNPTKDATILRVLTRSVPFDDSETLTSPSRILQRLARLLGLT